MTRDPETRRALTRVFDALGGEIQISWQQPPTRTKRERLQFRFELEDMIEAQVVGKSVFPQWASPSNERHETVAILHSTSDGVRSCLYGTGAKAGVTRRAMRPLHADQISELGVVYEEVVGSPSAELCLRHRGFMEAAITCADTNYILLHGAHALHAWRPDLTLKQYAGKVGLWNKRWWVLPVPQVDGVTTRRSEYSMEDWERLVNGFVELVQDPDPFHHVGTACVERVRTGTCDNGAEWWDEDAVPYCARHWEAAQKKKGEVQRRKAREARELERETLL